ncbi:MAG: HEAT repeat domain-containing protein [Cyanobacteriota bacterium]|nr:HEAT repeat domain-containing protein [Cyanobacteriota bacterium]
MDITPESVRQLLSSSDLGDRLRAVNQLRELKPATAFEIVVIACGDADTRVRYAAVSQLSTLGRENLAKSEEILRDRLLNDPEPDVQAAAADSLGGLQLTDAFEDLQQVYQATPEWLVKMSIVAAMGELGDSRGFSLLEDALKSDNELIQTMAISALGELGEPKAIPLLVPFADRGDWQVRFKLVQALSQLGGTQAKAILDKLTQDKSEPVASAAKTALNS